MVRGDQERGSAKRSLEGFGFPGFGGDLGGVMPLCFCALQTLSSERCWSAFCVHADLLFSLPLEAYMWLY